MPQQPSVYVAAALLAFTTALAFTVILRSIAADARRGASTRGRSLTRPPAPWRRPSSRPARIDDYGLLRTIAIVESLRTAQSVRALLRSAGIRSTVATGSDGLVRVLVFPEAYARARRMASWVL